MEANLDEQGAEALNPRLEAQLASRCGGEWCAELLSNWRHPAGLEVIGFIGHTD
jgi:hypothetical protein